MTAFCADIGGADAGTVVVAEATAIAIAKSVVGARAGAVTGATATETKAGRSSLGCVCVCDNVNGC